MAKLKSKKLQEQKVMENIWKLPSELRGKAKNWLKKKVQDRHGSESWAEEHPEALPVTDQQCVLMKRMHDKGVSFRALESIFHLIPNSGNDAQRCVRRAEELEKQNGNGHAKRKAKRATAVA